jgi:Protein of unknown function (DUF1573)
MRSSNCLTIKWVIAFCFTITLLGCRSNQDASTAQTNYGDKMPKMVFAEDVKNFDFGTITEGQIVEHKFKFENKGDFPLVINNVSTSCGCTVPEWPKEPIESGDSGVILVRFNSKNKMGSQSKSVSISANTNPPYSEIQFRVDVEAKKDSIPAKTSSPTNSKL